MLIQNGTKQFWQSWLSLESVTLNASNLFVFLFQESNPIYDPPVTSNMNPTYKGTID